MIEQTEVIRETKPPRTTSHPPDQLMRLLLIADGLFLFAVLSIAALLTPIPWLATTEAIGAVVSLIAAGRYWLDRRF